MNKVLLKVSLLSMFLVSCKNDHIDELKDELYSRCERVESCDTDFNQNTCEKYSDDIVQMLNEAKGSSCDEFNSIVIEFVSCSYTDNSVSCADDRLQYDEDCTDRMNSKYEALVSSSSYDCSVDEEYILDTAIEVIADLFI